MSRTRKITLGVGVLLVLTAFLVASLRTTGEGPEYQGTRLSTWLARYCAAINQGAYQMTRPSMDAFRALDTNAISYLVNVSCGPDSNPSIALIKAEAQPKTFGHSFPKGLDEWKITFFNLRARSSISGESIRNWSRQALVDLPVAATNLLPILAPKLEDPDAAVRARAAAILVRCVPQPDLATPGLLRVLRDPEIDVQVAALEAFSRLSPQSEALRQALQSAFEKASPAHQERMALELVKNPSKGREVLPFLLRVLPYAESRNRFALAEAIWAIDPTQPAAIAAMIKEAQSGEYYFHALRSLAQNPPAGKLPPEFFDGMKLNANTVNLCYRELRTLGLPKEKAVRILETALTTTNLMSRYHFALKVCDLNPDSAAALTALISVAKEAGPPRRATTVTRPSTSKSRRSSASPASVPAPPPPFPCCKLCSPTPAPKFPTP